MHTHAIMICLESFQSWPNPLSSFIFGCIHCVPAWYLTWTGFRFRDHGWWAKEARNLFGWTSRLGKEWWGLRLRGVNKYRARNQLSKVQDCIYHRSSRSTMEKIYKMWNQGGEKENWKYVSSESIPNLKHLPLCWLWKTQHMTKYSFCKISNHTQICSKSEYLLLDDWWLCIMCLVGKTGIISPTFPFSCGTWR